MEIKDYITILFPKIWLLILGALLAAVACYYVATTYTNWPTHEASGTLFIQKGTSDAAGQDERGLKISQRTLSALAVRPPITQNVVDNLGLDITAEDLAKLIRIQTPGDTPIIEINVSHKDAQTASSIANAVMGELQSYEEAKIKTSVLAPAKVPETPRLTSYLLLLIAGAIGATVAIGGVLLAEHFNDIVRHERDIVQQLDMPMLGQIRQSNNKSEDVLATMQKAYQWLFARIYIENGHIPTSLLITSPQPCNQQTEFVSMFIQCNLRHNIQKNGQLALSLLSDNHQSGLVLNQLVTDINTELEPQDIDNNVARITGSMYKLDVVERPMSISQSSEKRQSRIVDGPPVLSHVNTIMMSKRFEGVLMVLDAHKTRISDTKKAHQLLKDAGSNVMGAVLLS